MNIPAELFFTKDHEYCRVDGDIVTIGISDYAQEQLGDITYIELPEVGDSLSKGETFATVEAVKAASDTYMPISGEVVEINEELEDAPELVNQDCYSAGWIVKIKISDKSELEALMNADTYKASIG